MVQGPFHLVWFSLGERPSTGPWRTQDHRRHYRPGCGMKFWYDCPVSDVDFFDKN